MKMNDAHSWLASILSAGRGLRLSARAMRQPAATLELYEFEACPYCRKVREALSELDLNAIIRPCARGSNNRKQAEALGGKTQFPLLLDPNTGRQLYESEDIIDYLYGAYGEGRASWGRKLSGLNTFASGLASAVRPRGRVVRKGCEDRVQPEKLLELYNFEASPYCRKVRETLAELNLDHLVRNVAKGSSRRPELVAKGGKMQVPYLIDANTGTALYESDDIVRYLENTYGR